MASGAVSAIQVGTYFVGQYYHVLQKKPDLVHQFYNNASVMIRIDGDSSETASSVLQIHALLMSLNFAGIEIKTINSLDSWSGGLLVMASGYVKNKDFSGTRKFVQSFFLAPQEKGFFVLNDIFQFIEEEVMYQEQSPILSENNYDSQLNAQASIPEPSVSEYVLEEDAREYRYSVPEKHVEDDPVDKYSLPEQQQYQEPDPEIVVEESLPQETFSSIQNANYAVHDNFSTAFEEPIGVDPPAKKTWASIVSLGAPKGKSVSSVARQTPQQLSAPPASEWDHVPEPYTQQSYSEVSVFPESGVETTVGSLSLEDEGESRSIYVRNLPSNVTSAEIEQEFQKFGEIKYDGIFIKNREDYGVCYAFVEFEDVNSVQQAIKASPLHVAGRPVYIEERRANTNSTSRGRGGSSRGRGNYQTESSRGRFGGRGVGNDYGYGRARGTGYQQRGSQGY